ncbi:uncharacterized protein LOC133198529 [Saccostrea echinata]|uniref:uncharacterized protein LOC133198529 n=1 Tax=Saccostrea echinata TaxID=191078 RepID=UPI002A81E6F7|nr:uncharacterized protein LOC133198529 [Saccostrea echinata]
MKSDIDLELAVHKADIDKLARTIDSIVKRLERLENREQVQDIDRSRSTYVSEDVLSQIQSLEKTQKDIEKTMTDLQCRSMRDNLLFFGPAEYRGNRKEDYVALIDVFCDDLLRLRNIKRDIERAHRIGRRRDGECRPVLVKFSSYRVREKVRANASRLEDTRYAISEQFPRSIQEQRKQLYPILKEARRSGIRATMVVNRLYIEVEEYRGPETKETMVASTRDDEVTEG